MKRNCYCSVNDLSNSFVLKFTGDCGSTCAGNSTQYCGGSQTYGVSINQITCNNLKDLNF